MTTKGQRKAIGSTAAKRAACPHRPTGQWIRKEKRLAIYLRDRFMCLYCTKDLHDADPRDISLEHLEALIDGGSNHERNLITACVPCNCSRRDLPWLQFASPEARVRIRRNRRRSLRPHLVLAAAIIAGRTGSAAPGAIITDKGA